MIENQRLAAEYEEDAWLIFYYNRDEDYNCFHYTGKAYSSTEENATPEEALLLFTFAFARNKENWEDLTHLELRSDMVLLKPFLENLKDALIEDIRKDEAKDIEGYKGNAI